MKNYSFIDIEGPAIEYPDHTKQTFKTLPEYLKIAEKTIKYYSNKLPVNREQVRAMANSEDAISEVARHLMMADWRYGDGKGRGAYSYRNLCAKWAILEYLNSFQTRKNEQRASLDESIDDGASLYGIIEDSEVEDPQDQMARQTQKATVAKQIRFAMENSGLSEPQKLCIKYKFFDEIESLSDIGKRFNPPISRQAVNQNITRGLFRMKQTLAGAK